MFSDGICSFDGYDMLISIPQACASRITGLGVVGSPRSSYGLKLQWRKCVWLRAFGRRRRIAMINDGASRQRVNFSDLNLDSISVGYTPALTRGTPTY